jgi:hypothetical protein
MDDAESRELSIELAEVDVREDPQHLCHANTNPICLLIGQCRKRRDTLPLARGQASQLFVGLDLSSLLSFTATTIFRDGYILFLQDIQRL